MTPLAGTSRLCYFAATSHAAAVFFLRPVLRLRLLSASSSPAGIRRSETVATLSIRCSVRAIICLSFYTHALVIALEVGPIPTSQRLMGDPWIEGGCALCHGRCAVGMAYGGRFSSPIHAASVLCRMAIYRCLSDGSWLLPQCVWHGTPICPGGSKLLCLHHRRCLERDFLFSGLT